MKVDIAKIIIKKKFAKRSIVHVWQDSEYGSGSEYNRVLNIPGLWMYQNPEYTWVPNMKPATLLKKCFFVNFAKLLRTTFNKTPPNESVYSLRNTRLFFWWGEIGIFSCSWKNLVFFCLRLNIFTSKISYLLLPLGVKLARVWESEAVNLDISKRSVVVLWIKGWLKNCTYVKSFHSLKMVDFTEIRLWEKNN